MMHSIKVRRAAGFWPGRSSCDSGWLRRVSEKRATSECVFAVRNMTLTSWPSSRSG
jgi:hypothetical protein